MFMMKIKILIIALFFSMLFLNNFNQTYADNHTLKSLLKKKKNKSNNTISGSTSNNSSKNTPSLKKCDKKIATLAVVEPQDYEMLALMQYSLPSPTSLIRLIVQQSNCFIVVERGLGMQNILQERSLSSSGELKSDQNIGKGQMITADYVLTPTIVFKESNAGGLGALGGLLPGAAGSVGGIIGGSLKFKESQTTLTLADTRSGIQVAAAAGSSKKTDLGVVIGLGGNSAGAGLGAYANTAEGKVVAAAFLNSYNYIVDVVDGDVDLVRENSLLQYKKEGSKKIKKVKKEVIGDVKVAKINNVPVSSDSEGKNILFKLSSKEEVVILGEKGDFYNIMASEGEGWVKKILLK